MKPNIIEKTGSIVVSIMIYLFSFSAPNAAACTLEIPQTSNFRITNVDSCYLRIAKQKNYFELSYYKATTKGLNELINEGIDIAFSNRELYIPIEFINDANYSVESISSHPLKKRSVDSSFLEARSVLHVTSMPKKRLSRADFFSLRLQCLEAAGGDEKTSFTTRYCIPFSKNSERELVAYRKFVEGIDIKGDR